MSSQNQTQTHRYLTMICTFLASIGLTALIIISGMTVVDAGLQKFAGTHINGMSDWLSFCLIIAVSCCFPATILDKYSITVRVIGNFLPWRIREILETFGQLALCLCLVIIGWQLYIYTYELWDYGDVSDMLLLPKWPVWAVATAIWILTSLIQLHIVFCQAISVFGKQDPQKQSEHL